MHITQVSSLLNREYPMLLLDGVTHIEPRVICRAYKNLSYNEWFFPAHFPNQPVMPGTFQVEAYTQAAALPLLVDQEADSLSEIPLLLGAIDRVRFYKSVVPGDRLDICAKIDRIAMGMATASITGSVNDETVSECRITYKITGEE